MKTNTLRLGQMNSRADALHKIHAWAKNAKSFTITKINRSSQITHNGRRPYFEIVVEYFSGKKEGKYILGGWDWKRYCLKKERYEFQKKS